MWPQPSPTDPIGDGKPPSTFTLLICTARVTKRLIEIDDDLLRRARAAAGTETIRATVETALQRLIDRDTALRHVARLRRRGALDLGRLSEARRPRHGTHA